MEKKALTKENLTETLGYPWCTFLGNFSLLGIGDDGVLLVVTNHISSDWMSHPAFVMRVLRAARTLDPAIKSISFSENETLFRISGYGTIVSLKRT